METRHTWTWNTFGRVVIIMIFDHEQLKHLEVDGEDTFKYVENGVATEEEKQELRDLDDDYFQMFGFHIITNLDEIK